MFRIGNGKKGVSDIIVTLIMIVIVIGAITIVWLLIRGLIDTSVGQVNTGTQCLEVDIKPVALSCTGVGNSTCDVTVSRGVGGDEIGGVKLVFTNSTGSQNYISDVPGDINVLETKTVSGVNVVGIENVNSVDVIVYFNDNTGRELLCSTKTTYSN